MIGTVALDEEVEITTCEKEKIAGKVGWLVTDQQVRRLRRFGLQGLPKGPLVHRVCALPSGWHPAQG
jgi:hypothetical protein